MTNLSTLSDDALAPHINNLWERGKVAQARAALAEAEHGKEAKETAEAKRVYSDLLGEWCVARQALKARLLALAVAHGFGDAEAIKEAVL